MNIVLLQDCFKLVNLHCMNQTVPSLTLPCYTYKLFNDLHLKQYTQRTKGCVDCCCYIETAIDIDICNRTVLLL